MCLDFFGGETIAPKIALEICCHRFGKILFRRLAGDDYKSPRLTVMRGGRERRSGKNVLYDGIRYRVRFEAADRAASPQKVVKVSRSEGQSGGA